MSAELASKLQTTHCIYQVAIPTAPVILLFHLCQSMVSKESPQTQQFQVGVEFAAWSFSFSESVQIYSSFCVDCDQMVLLQYEYEVIFGQFLQ
jgi:flagellar biosynthesis protein FliR